jgi:hypothetical protein
MGVGSLRQRVLWWGSESPGRLPEGLAWWLRRGMGTVRPGRISLRPGCRVWPFDREPAWASGQERDRVWLEGSVALSERGTARRSREQRGSGLTAALGLWDEVPSKLEYRLIVGRYGTVVCYSHLTWPALGLLAWQYFMGWNWIHYG